MPSKLPPFFTEINQNHYSLKLIAWMAMDPLNGNGCGMLVAITMFETNVKCYVPIIETILFNINLSAEH
ncbi:hypothetical protein BLOT_010438 [Blomia tropicalis]|nr:hypothetical protein BLOT_010438 [Blomia tropicalis]